MCIYIDKGIYPYSNMNFSCLIQAPGAYVPAGQLTYAEPEGWIIE